MHTIEAFATFLNVPNSPTPIIAFNFFLSHMFLNSDTSSYNFFQSFLKTYDLLITMSISSAPDSIDS